MNSELHVSVRELEKILILMTVLKLLLKFPLMSAIMNTESVKIGVRKCEDVISQIKE